MNCTTYTYAVMLNNCRQRYSFIKLFLSSIGLIYKLDQVVLLNSTATWQIKMTTNDHWKACQQCLL